MASLVEDRYVAVVGLRIECHCRFHDIDPHRGVDVVPESYGRQRLPAFLVGDLLRECVRPEWFQPLDFAGICRRVCDGLFYAGMGLVAKEDFSEAMISLG